MLESFWEVMAVQKRGYEDASAGFWAEDYENMSDLMQSSYETGRLNYFEHEYNMKVKEECQAQDSQST